VSFPFHLKLGVFEISAHLIFETLAFIIGFQYYLFLRKSSKDQLNSEERFWILIAVCLGALFFSRLIAVMEHINLIQKNTPISFYYSQKTIVGGLLGGLIAVEVTKKLLGITKSSGDLMTYPILLGMIIGRIGCFLSGLEDGTYGVETNTFLGVDFGDGLKRHPTQLYEIIFLLILWILIYLLTIPKFWNFIGFKNNRLDNYTTLADGMKFKIFLFSYLIFRFFIEFIKPVSKFAFQISFIQIACLIGIFYYLILAFVKINFFRR